MQLARVKYSVIASKEKYRMVNADGSKHHQGLVEGENGGGQMAEACFADAHWKFQIQISFR